MSIMQRGVNTAILTDLDKLLNQDSGFRKEMNPLGRAYQLDIHEYETGQKDPFNVVKCLGI